MKINGVDISAITKINNVSKASITKMSGVTFATPSPIPAGIVTAGLIMYLDAGVSASYPGSGSTWTDITYNGNNGTLINSPTYSSANGGSILFDGVDDYVGLTNVTLSVPSGQNFVWNAWVKTPAVLSGYKMILSVNSYYQYLSLYNNQFVLDARGYATLRFGTLTPNTWYNVTVVRESNIDYQYINGVLINSKANATGFGGTLAVGKWAYNNTLYYNSNISVVSIYNAKLNAAEVLQNFDTLKSRYGY